MDATIIDVLTIISNQLKTITASWAIGSSCGLALHGINIQPNDIDIVTTRRGIFEIAAALDTFKISVPTHRPSATFDSLMAEFVIAGKNVEIIGDFKVRSHPADIWYNVTDDLNGVTYVVMPETHIPVLPLTSLMRMYVLMKRAKDENKIKQIMTRLKQLS